MWAGNPRITQSADSQPIVNGPGCRPYIEHHDNERFYWADWQVPGPGEIAYEHEPPIGARYTLIIPGIKDRAPPGKQWPAGRFAQVADLIGPDVVEMVWQGSKPVTKRSRKVTVNNFFAGLELLRRADAVICNEGGYHHAAAAMGIPAVVIFGGFISPDITGYEGHANLYAGGEACGVRGDCSHCRDAMDAIKVAHVIDAYVGLDICPAPALSASA